jgi:hypothetical protein
MPRTWQTCKDMFTRERRADAVIDESKIAAHDNPVARERSNYMIRLDLVGVLATRRPLMPR